MYNIHCVIWETYIHFSWNYKFWGTAIHFKSTLVSSVCENCTSRQLFCYLSERQQELNDLEKISNIWFVNIPRFLLLFLLNFPRFSLSASYESPIYLSKRDFRPYFKFLENGSEYCKSFIFHKSCSNLFTYNNYYLSIIKVAHNCHTINLYSLRVCITFYGS